MFLNVEVRSRAEIRPGSTLDEPLVHLINQIFICRIVDNIDVFHVEAVGHWSSAVVVEFASKHLVPNWLRICV